MFFLSLFFLFLFSHLFLLKKNTHTFIWTIIWKIIYYLIPSFLLLLYNFDLKENQFQLYFLAIKYLFVYSFCFFSVFTARIPFFCGRASYAVLCQRKLLPNWIVHYYQWSSNAAISFDFLVHSFDFYIANGKTAEARGSSSNILWHRQWQWQQNW